MYVYFCEINIYNIKIIFIVIYPCKMFSLHEFYDDGKGRVML